MKIGLMPDGGGTFWLPRLVGTARAMQMILLAEKVEAAELARARRRRAAWSTPEALREATLALAREIEAGPPLAFAAIKRALYASWGSFEDALRRERTSSSSSSAARTRSRASPRGCRSASRDFAACDRQAARSEEVALAGVAEDRDDDAAPEGRAATSHAAWTFAPDDGPTSRPSSRASRRAMRSAATSVTVHDASMTLRSRIFGTNPAPRP